MNPLKFIKMCHGTTDSKISFDEKGICDHCNTYEKEILPSWNYGKGRRAS